MRPSLLPLLLALPLACSDGTGPSAPPPPATLALGGRHACRATPAGTWCWGRGAEAQLGRAVPVETGSPAAVEGAPGFVALAAGEAHTCGLEEAGAVWCWGSGADGQLGLAEADLANCLGLPCAPLPLPVRGLPEVVAIAAGGTTTCALDGSGQAWCWGRNDLWQLGTTAAPDQCGFYVCGRSPLPVSGGHRFRSITVSGNDHACGLTRGGEAWCWGFGRQGQLGNDVLVERSLPVRVAGGVAFRHIAAGGLHTCAVDRADRAWCWGIDAVGAGGTPLETHVPVRVEGGHRYDAIAAGRFTSCGTATDGSAWCWGPNSRGEIGTGPVGSAVRFDVPSAVSGGRRFREVAAGSFTYCGIDGDGTAWCWGEGANGELGVAGLPLSTAPVRVALPE